MATTKKAIYKVDNGTDFDTIHFQTAADQVTYTPSGGTASTVKAALDNVNSNLTIENVAISTANANYITVASHRVRKQGKQIHGFVYFQTTQAVTGPANIISVGFDVPSTIYLPIYNLTDGTVGYGTLETTKYLKNGSALAANKVLLVCIDFTQP